jgi:sugar phosphate isomerase/epimerase
MAKIGLQLWTVRDALDKDFTGTLRAVAKSGYDGIEGGGTGPLNEKAYSTLMKELKLENMGAHVGLDEFEGAKLEKRLAYHRRLGIKYLGYSHWEKHMNAETWKRIAAPMNRVGKAARAHGMVFQYHNHAHEFVQYGGRTALDILLGESDPRWVKSQLDVGWVARAGQNPVAWMRKLGRRIATIHLKDTTKGPKPQWTEVGTGILPLEGVVATAKKLDIPWFVVEQDWWDIPSTTSAAISYANARKVIG